jgi:hypothetical protein
MTNGTFVTTILKEQVALLPFASAAVYRTAVVPTGKLPPGKVLAVIVGLLQLSVAVGLVHWAITEAEAVVRLMLVGQLINRGLTVSVAQLLVKVTLKEQVDLLPLASVAV